MSKNTGGNAFPLQKINSPGCSVHYGITIRDYFAAHAMAKITSDKGVLIGDREAIIQDIAETSYKIADAMLTERDKSGREVQ